MSKRFLGLMILMTGALYVVYPDRYSLGVMLNDSNLYQAFIYSCFLCGFMGLFMPKKTSMIVVMAPIAILATPSLFRPDGTVSGFITYASAFGIAGFVEAKRELRLKYLGHIKTRQYMGFIIILMSIGLIVRPHDIGLDYIYARLSFLTYPVVMYQIMFALTGILCILPIRPNMVTPYFYGFAMMMHTGLFVYISVVNLQAYESTVVLIIAFYVWFMAGREGLDDYINKHVPSEGLDNLRRRPDIVLTAESSDVRPGPLWNTAYGDVIVDMGLQEAK